MKAKRTMRDIKSQYPTIIQVSYCDSKLLKTLHPDVYAECSSKTVYKRFSVV